MQGKLDQALADFDMAAKLDPKDAEIWLNMAATHEMRADFVRAIADISEAMRLVPNDAGLFDFRARLHDKLGNTEAAKNDRASARKLRDR